MARKTKAEKKLSSMLSNVLDWEPRLRVRGLTYQISKPNNRLCIQFLYDFYPGEEPPAVVFEIRVFTYGEGLRWKADMNFCFANPEHYEMVTVIYRMAGRYFKMYQEATA